MAIVSALLKGASQPRAVVADVTGTGSALPSLIGIGVKLTQTKSNQADT